MKQYIIKYIINKLFNDLKKIYPFMKGAIIINFNELFNIYIDTYDIIEENYEIRCLGGADELCRWLYNSKFDICINIINLGLLRYNNYNDNILKIYFGDKHYRIDTNNTKKYIIIIDNKQYTCDTCYEIREYIKKNELL